MSMESHLWCYKIKLTSETCENPSPNKMKTEKVTSSVPHTVALICVHVFMCLDLVNFSSVGHQSSSI